MVTASHIVKKIVSEQAFVEEGLSEGIISVAGLSEKMLPAIEKELGKKIKLPAVVMALRRYADEIAEHRKKAAKFDYSGEILMKTSICDVNFVKSSTLMKKLKTIHDLVNFER